MQIILDNLGATLIAVTIFLMIFNLNSRNGQTLTETTAFYMVTTQTEAFAKILRRDLQGVADILTITEETQLDGSTEFRFDSRIGDDTTRHTIIYRKQASLVRHGIPFYYIERVVDGVVEGGSLDILTDWEIVALNEDAGNITDPDDAAQVYVRFETASPMVEADVVQSIRWETRFFPPLLN